ncbi:unnamed protein product, partial [Ectocarpus sp. 12 AP-2014]
SSVLPLPPSPPSDEISAAPSLSALPPCALWHSRAKSNARASAAGGSSPRLAGVGSPPLASDEGTASSRSAPSTKASKVGWVEGPARGGAAALEAATPSAAAGAWLADARGGWRPRVAAERTAVTLSSHRETQRRRAATSE